MKKIKVKILGSGGSFGVPVLFDRWGKCDPDNKKNIRTRPSAILEKDGKTILIDTSPDLRFQMIDNKINKIDSVLFTHAHADHIHGINDLRCIHLATNKKVPVYVDKSTKLVLLKSFEYLFSSKNLEQYPPICEIKDYEAGNSYKINGFNVQVIHQNHGNIDSLGYIFDNKIAYNLDVKYFYDKNYLDLIKGIECWILGCLRYEKHPAHAEYDEILKWIDYVQPKKTYLSHMTALIDYETEYQNLSKYNIFPSYDGCTFHL